MSYTIRNHHVKNTLKIAIGGTIGFTLFWMTSHPRSNIHKRLPQKKMRNLQILPQLKYTGKDKEIHFHHWLNLVTIYVLLYVKKHKLLRSKLLRGMFLGGILQGLIYKDRFRIVKKI